MSKEKDKYFNEKYLFSPLSIIRIDQIKRIETKVVDMQITVYAITYGNALRSNLSESVMLLQTDNVEHFNEYMENIRGAFK